MYLIPGSRCVDCGRRDWWHSLRSLRLRIGWRLERFGRRLADSGRVPIHPAPIDYTRIPSGGKDWILVEPFTSRVIAEGDNPSDCIEPYTVEKCHERGWIMTRRQG